MRHAGLRRSVSMTLSRRLIIVRILIIAALAVIEELAYQIFQHHGGLGVLNRTAVFKNRGAQFRVFKTDVQRQVLLPEQTRSTNRQRAGIRNVVVAFVDIDGNARQIGFLDRG